MSEIESKPRGGKLLCPICSSTFFNLFPAGECQTCSQLVCGHCIHHDNPDHSGSICDVCIVEATPSGQIALMKNEELSGLLEDPLFENKLIVSRVMGDRKDPAFVVPLCKALESGQPELRREAASALGKFDSDDAISHLINALNDPEPSVRGKAASSLGDLGADVALDPLLNLIEDTSLQAAGHAIWAIGKLMGQEGSDILNRLIETHSSNFIRCEALAVLAGINPDQALKAAMECLNDPKKEVIISACKILTKLKDPMAIPVLEKRIPTIPSTLARLRAESTLDRLKKPDENLI